MTTNAGGQLTQVEEPNPAVEGAQAGNAANYKTLYTYDVLGNLFTVEMLGRGATQPKRQFN